MDLVASHLGPENRILVNELSVLLKSVLGSDQALAIKHIERVFHSLVDLRADLDTLLAALLCPLLATDAVPEGHLVQTFGQQTVRIARGVLALSKSDLSKRHLSEQKSAGALQADRLRRLFASAYDDFRIPLICVTDHKAKFTDSMEYLERRLWAAETEAVFLPLCHMLGLWQWRRELGDLSLPLVQPKIYEQVSSYISLYCQRHKVAYTEVEQVVQRELAAHGINGSVNLHVSRPSSLYRRLQLAEMKGQKQDLDDLIDLVRLDVQVPSELECYQVLGLIHRQWRPIGRQQDHIADPRYNGYRCLKTMVVKDEGKGASQKTMEFRIRTYEMEKTNTQGIAAARFGSSPPVLIKNTWWEDEDLRELVRSQELGSSAPTIYVFSPIGEIYQLPRHSTPIDYAFRVHSTLGPHASQLWVNGQQVNYDCRLCNGDLVAIEFDPSLPGLAPQWQKVVQTTTARSKLEHLRRQRDATPHKGRKLIEKVLTRELAIYGLHFPADELESSLAKVARSLDYSSLSALCLGVAERKTSPDKVVALAIQDQLVGHIIQQDGSSWPRDRISIAQCWISFDRQRKSSKDTRVVPGAEIVGHIRDRGNAPPILVVHRKDCPNALGLPDPIPLRWRTMNSPREAIVLSISAWDKPQLLDTILRAVYGLYDQGLYLHRVYAEILQDGSATIELTIDAPSHDQISLLAQKFEDLKRQGHVKECLAWQPLPGQRILLAGRASVRHQNPYTLQAIRSGAMFFGRAEETAKILDCIHEGQNLIVLYGRKRVGKTSLLYHLVNSFPQRERDILPVILDLQAITPFDTSLFLTKLADTIYRDLAEHLGGRSDAAFSRLRLKDVEAEPFGAFRRWITQVHERLAGHKLLVLIDEFGRTEQVCESKTLDPTFFEGLRWAITGHLNTVFLLCVQDTIYNPMAFSRPACWSLLCDAYPIRLEALDDESAVRLIRQPMGHFLQYEEPVVSRLLDLTGCNPFFLQIICREIIAHMIQSNRSRVVLDDVCRVIPRVLAHGRHYFSHFLEDARGWNMTTLAAVAHTTDDDFPWLAEDRIHGVLEKYGYLVDPGVLKKTVTDLSWLGFIESRDGQLGPEYRIRVGLFRLWLQDNIPASSLIHQPGRHR